MKLLMATRNQGKFREYECLLADLELDLVDLTKAGIVAEVEETGATFEENALLKAGTYCQVSGLLTLADDSGLEVDALGGEPGVLSARYAGENASDEQRVAFLLSKLTDVPWAQRTARFRCVIAIAHSSGTLELCEGQCCGFVTFEPRGTQGFGYDPIFYIPEFDRTMAELSIDEKNRVSHRGRAAQKAHEILRRLSLRT